MSITKLKWQWQSSNWQRTDLVHVTPSHRAQVGRVITGMLTGDDPRPQSHHHPLTRASGSRDHRGSGS